MGSGGDALLLVWVHTFICRKITAKEFIPFQWLRLPHMFAISSKSFLLYSLVNYGFGLQLDPPSFLVGQSLPPPIKKKILIKTQQKEKEQGTLLHRSGL